jgi:hypothetical protein
MLIGTPHLGKIPVPVSDTSHHSCQQRAHVASVIGSVWQCLAIIETGFFITTCI